MREGRYAVVATTRPGNDHAVIPLCVYQSERPEDEWLKGKKVIVPLVNHVIPGNRR